MIRSLSNIAALLSLLLWCLIAVAWVGGRRTPRFIELGHTGAVWQIGTHAGKLCLDNSPQQRLDREPCVWLQRKLQRDHERRSVELDKWLEERRKADTEGSYAATGPHGQLRTKCWGARRSGTGPRPHNGPSDLPSR